MSIKNFVASVSECITRNKLLSSGQNVCVCLSGGADSVSLLLSLKELVPQLKVNLSAIHINHCIRGAEADRDEQFCVSLCNSLKIQLAVYKIDVPLLHTTSGKSIEETARDARYNAFENYAKIADVDIFATAHTASDNAETVLMNIFRGTTVGGLCGIPVKRGIFVRPLIDLYRTDVLEYLNQNKQDYVSDSTNYVNDCTRNIIRNEILPLIFTINPAADKAINRLAKNGYATDRLLHSFYSGDEKLSDLPRQAAIMVLRDRHHDFCGCGLTVEHAERLIDLLDSNTNVSLPNQVIANVRDGDIQFSNKAAKKDVDTGVYRLVSGDNYFDNRNVIIYYGLQKPQAFDYIVSIDAKSISGDMFYRSRRVGDTIHCLGVNKSVKKEFIDKKIPVALRDHIPIIYDTTGVVCVPFIGVDDKLFSREKDAAYIAVRFSERLDFNK